MTLKLISLYDALDALPDGARVFLPGSSGAPPGFAEALQSSQRRLDVTTTLVPGVNALDFARLPATVTVTGLFMQPSFGAAQHARRFRHLPLSYAGFSAWLERSAPFDAAIVHVTPPDGEGRCSLGAAVEFSLMAAASAKRIIGVINPNMPRPLRAPSLPSVAFKNVCDGDAPLARYEPGGIGALNNQIAARIASFIENRATLQLGLGKIPAALPAHLHDRQALRLWSGILSDGALDLLDSSVICAGECRTSVVLGSERLYGRIDRRDDFEISGCDVTHDLRRLLELDELVAVNGAVEVDLFGQCNLERIDGGAVSGAGGAPDFIRAAHLSPRGLSIVALPSQADRRSRIVPVLGASAMVTLPRSDIDVVVTEHGAADLRGKSVLERAEAIMGLAAPQHRAGLDAAWRDICARL